MAKIRVRHCSVVLSSIEVGSGGQDVSKVRALPGMRHLFGDCIISSRYGHAKGD